MFLYHDSPHLLWGLNRESIKFLTIIFTESCNDFYIRAYSQIPVLGWPGPPPAGPALETMRRWLPAWCVRVTNVCSLFLFPQGVASKPNHRLASGSVRLPLFRTIQTGWNRRSTGGWVLKLSPSSRFGILDKVDLAGIVTYKWDWCMGHGIYIILRFYSQNPGAGPVLLNTGLWLLTLKVMNWSINHRKCYHCCLHAVSWAQDTRVVFH